MSKLAHSNDEGMREIDRRRLRDEGYSEAEILALENELDTELESKV